MTDLCKRHRPRTLDDVVGQPEAVKVLKGFLKAKSLPRCLLIAGPSGCGKTTIARILRRELGCGRADFQEIDFAQNASIELIRSLQQQTRYRTLSGKPRLWCFDEVQSMSRVAFAQQAMLKMLEDGPDDLWFVLATTDPAKLLPTILTRCTRIDLKPLSEKDLHLLITQKVDPQGTSEKVLKAIAEAADGSARTALKLLEKALQLDSEEDRLAAVGRSGVQRAAIDLCRALMKKSNWKEVSEIIKALADEDHEQVRRAVLGYCSAVILSGGPMAKQAYSVLLPFENNFYDTGRCGLIRAAWECFSEH